MRHDADVAVVHHLPIDRWRSSWLAASTYGGKDSSNSFIPLCFSSWMQNKLIAKNTHPSIGFRESMIAGCGNEPWLYEGDGDDLAIPPPGFKSAFPRDWQRNIMNITTPEHWSPYPSPFKKFEPSSSKREICFSEHEHQEESLASFNDDVG